MEFKEWHLSIESQNISNKPYLIMKNHPPIFYLLRVLWIHIGRRRQWQFIFLLGLMLLGSFAEIISIGTVFPFLGALTSPEHLYSSPVLQPMIQNFKFTNPNQLLLPLTLVFGVAIFFSGAMRLLLFWASTRLAFSIGAELGIDIYRRTLYQPYLVHCSRNSSEVIAGITGKANAVIHNIILPTLTLISSSMMLVAILFALLSIEPFIAVSAFVGLGLIYSCIILLTRKKLLANSHCIAQESVRVIKSLQEGLGGIRDVLIDGTQTVYCQIYRESDFLLRRAQSSSIFIGANPRYGMETLGMLLIISLAYILAQKPGGITTTIPILGALAIGAQRLLPVLQQSYSSWTSIRSGQAGLQDTLELLNQHLPVHADSLNPNPIVFSHSLQLKNLGFRYDLKSPWVIRNLDLIVPKGSRIGFIGTTGSGKSTLLDVVMGLLFPTEGEILVDDRPLKAADYDSWRSHIAHVPQAIFLSDSTIEENIAFGIPKEFIDLLRVKKAAQQAQIADSIESWPEQYQTIVGERGIRLSGGQRQRIGIARALYKQADIIIFDEATSALDGATEQSVMQAIESLSKELTLLIVAHRLSTLKNCTQIVEIADGKIVRSGNYKQIMIKYE